MCTVRITNKVDQNGKAVVMISPDQNDSFRGAVMERFREARDELQRLNADKDPDEVLRDVTEIVEEVRREQYEREQQEQTSQ